MRFINRNLAVVVLAFGGILGALPPVLGGAAQAEECVTSPNGINLCNLAPEYRIGFKGTETYLPLRRLEIARTPDKRAQGLMGRAALADDQAMLFVYPDEAPRAFWMKDTPSPLDIIFINGAGTVVAIGADAIPFDETPIPSVAPARYVLEVAAGRAAALGLRVGVELQIKKSQFAPQRD